MNELPSATFRRTYARLSEPAVVTVNGHVIGVWTPTQAVTAATPKDIRPVIQASQSKRDELLRKINRG